MFSICLLTVVCGIILIACNKNGGDTEAPSNEPTSGSNQSLNRTSLNAIKLITSGDEYNVDIDLMSDYTWSGNMSLANKVVATDYLTFTKTQTSVFADSAGNLQAHYLNPSTSKTEKLSFANFTSLAPNSYQFDVLSSGQLVKTVTIMSEQINSIAELKNGLIGTWDNNTPLLRTTSPVLIYRLVVIGIIAVANTVTNHCSKVVEAARANCSTPPCKFEAGFCWANCICPQK